MSQQVGIKNSWSLVEFKKIYGQKKLKMTPVYINEDSGDEFRSLAFINNDDKITLVGFSSNLGQLTSAEVIAKKDELRVVQLESGKYKLCKGNNTDEWETIEL